MTTLLDAPLELQVAIQEFWPTEQWDNAAGIAYLESDFDAFAKLDTATKYGGCGIYIGEIGGVRVVSERSVGYYQINTCNYPTWEWQRLYNARHNAGTAHMIWTYQGWGAWYFSAKTLGLLS
jgi:hypothetical protein